MGEGRAREKENYLASQRQYSNRAQLAAFNGIGFALLGFDSTKVK